jgi:hypothetical protein
METKNCNKCLENKTLENYYLSCGKHRTYCKACCIKQVKANPNKKISEKKYYENHREEILTRAHIYYTEEGKSKEYYEKNKEYKKEQMKLYYEKNKEKAKEYYKEYNKNKKIIKA